MNTDAIPMRAARLHALGDIRLSEEPRPAATADTSVVRVSAVGLCGSDLHWFGEGGIGDARLDAPLVLGHEIAGVVESGPLAGRRVAVDPAVACGTCEQCLAGHRNLCPNVRFAGHGTQDGGLREYLAWPTRLLHPLPDAISDAGGAVLEPLGVAIHALDLGHMRVGSRVAVVGCGPIGLLLVQLARVAGATSVVAVDPLAHRREAARRFGADLALSPQELHGSGGGTAAGASDTAAGGVAAADVPVDVAFEAAGPDDAVDAALTLARPGARVVLAGIPDHDRTAFRASVARRKGLTLVMVRRMGEVYPRAIRLVERGLVDVDAVVSARYPLSRVSEAFASAVRREGLKVIVEPSAH